MKKVEFAWYITDEDGLPPERGVYKITVRSPFNNAYGYYYVTMGRFHPANPSEPAVFRDFDGHDISLDRVIAWAYQDLPYSEEESNDNRRDDSERD